MACANRGIRVVSSHSRQLSPPVTCYATHRKRLGVDRDYTFELYIELEGQIA